MAPTCSVFINYLELVFTLLPQIAHVISTENLFLQDYFDILYILLVQIFVVRRLRALTICRFDFRGNLDNALMLNVYRDMCWTFAGKESR